MVEIVQIIYDDYFFVRCSECGKLYPFAKDVAGLMSKVNWICRDCISKYFQKLKEIHMLVEDKKLYEILANAIREEFACMGDTFYFHIHAIYEPEHDGEPYDDMYHAAVDLFEEGLTYHCWFVVNDDGSVTGPPYERWYIG